MSMGYYLVWRFSLTIFEPLVYQNLLFVVMSVFIEHFSALLDHFSVFVSISGLFPHILKLFLSISDYFLAFHNHFCSIFKLFQHFLVFLIHFSAFSDHFPTFPNCFLTVRKCLDNHLSHTMQFKPISVLANHSHLFIKQARKVENPMLNTFHFKNMYNS